MLVLANFSMAPHAESATKAIHCWDTTCLTAWPSLFPSTWLSLAYHFGTSQDRTANSKRYKPCRLSKLASRITRLPDDTPSDLPITAPELLLHVCRGGRDMLTHPAAFQV